jgi:hypothetical protein
MIAKRFHLWEMKLADGGGGKCEGDGGEHDQSTLYAH